MRRSCAGWAGVLALALSGCTIASAPPRTAPPAGVRAAATAPTTGVCALVPGIEGILGRQLMFDAMDSSAGSDSHCSWVLNDHPPEVIALTVGRPERFADDVETFSLLTDGVGLLVSGLGTEARWFDAGPDFQSALVVRTGRYGVTVAMNTVERDRSIAEAIARAALGALP